MQCIKCNQRLRNKKKRKSNELSMGEVTEDDDAGNWIRLRTLGKEDGGSFAMYIGNFQCV
jgi:hypothetical protein